MYRERSVQRVQRVRWCGREEKRGAARVQAAWAKVSVSARVMSQLAEFTMRDK